MANKGIKESNSKTKFVELIILFVMLMGFFALIFQSVRLINFSRPDLLANMILSITSVFFTILLYYFCVSGYTWDVNQKHMLEIMLLLLFLSNLLIYSTNVSVGNPQYNHLTMLLYTLMYILSSFYWIAFWFFQKSSFQPLIGEKNCQTLFIVFFCCYTLIAIVNYFSHFCFYISEEGVLITKSLLLVILTTLWFIIYILTAITGKANIKTKLTLSSYALLPLLGWISVLIFYDSTFFSNIFESLDILFYLISLYLLFFNIYVEQGQISVQREKELIDSRAKAMTLKIRPHFIANTMSSIVALCDSDSAKAGELASKFAKYLRDNYADMTDEPMIPFSQELEHIKNYLSIEQIRFKNLNVEYDIRVENFSLPALTIQPLVENAVRHGISKMPGAKGNLLIKTYTDKGNYVIEIRDDGVGYVPTVQNDNRSHIGITNARFRLETLCHGSLKISGDADKGTICEVRIPIDYNEEK